jgi:Zn-dependent membrane protease YugP
MKRNILRMRLFYEKEIFLRIAALLWIAISVRIVALFNLWKNPVEIDASGT